MGQTRSLWLRWKMLRLPWRKNFLIGQDLEGNTYWEMKDALNSDRNRRMVRYARKTQHGDAKVTPQWHQWLRHTRAEPPTLQEQAYDIARQTQLKHNAALADARWAAKAKYIEKPAPSVQDQSKLLPSESQRTGDGSSGVDQKQSAQKTAVNPGADYQPEAWVPGSSR